MPVITVSVPADAPPAPLLDVANAAAAALDLGDGDVVAMALPYAGIARSGNVAGRGDWALVKIHGSDRGPAARAAALSAMEDAMLVWGRQQEVEIEGVWSEWALP